MGWSKRFFCSLNTGVVLPMVLVRKALWCPGNGNNGRGFPFQVERVPPTAPPPPPPAPTCASCLLVSNNGGFERVQRLLGFLEPLMLKCDGTNDRWASSLLLGLTLCWDVPLPMPAFHTPSECMDFGAPLMAGGRVQGGTPTRTLL